MIIPLLLSFLPATLNNVVATQLVDNTTSIDMTESIIAVVNDNQFSPQSKYYNRMRTYEVEDYNFKNDIQYSYSFDNGLSYLNFGCSCTYQVTTPATGGSSFVNVQFYSNYDNGDTIYSNVYLKDVTLRFQINNNDYYVYLPDVYFDGNQTILSATYNFTNTHVGRNAIDFFYLSYTMAIVPMDYVNVDNQPVYDSGYNQGFADGKSEGYQQGYTAGYDEANNQDSTALTIFNGIINIALIPVNFFLAIFNFEVFGINIGAIVSATLTIAIVIIIIRIITGKKND